MHGTVNQSDVHPDAKRPIHNWDQKHGHFSLAAVGRQAISIEEPKAKAENLLLLRDLRRGIETDEGDLEFPEELTNEIPETVLERIYDPTPLTCPVQVPEGRHQLKQLSARDQGLWRQAEQLEWDGRVKVKRSFDPVPVPIEVAKRQGVVVGFVNVYTRRKGDGRLKTRTSARGDMEKDHFRGVTSAPTIHYDELKLLLTVGLYRGFKFATLDSPMAFLRAPLPEDRAPVFMKPPPYARILPEDCQVHLRTRRCGAGMVLAARQAPPILRTRPVQMGTMHLHLRGLARRSLRR